jgi:hypothetical protein
VLARLRTDLGLRYDVTAEQHPVDEFIDPTLRRHTVTWDELDVPRDLQEIAQDVWDALQPLADGDGDDPSASEVLDELAARYEQVLADASAIDLDGRAEAVATARRRGAREALEAEHAEPGGRPVRDVPAKELVKVLGRRAAMRLGRGSRAGL